jgi:hypothetical protein
MDPRSYLNKFFVELNDGNQELMRFYASAYRDLRIERLLEFGGGPAIHSLISATIAAKTIHFVDASSSCLDEVKLWLNDAPDGFNWRPYIAEALKWESPDLLVPSENAVTAREKKMREHEWRFSLCNAFYDDILLGTSLQPYQAVASNFCLDGITNDKNTWRELVAKLASKVAANGTLIMSTLSQATSWTVDGISYPSVSLALAEVIDEYSLLGFNVSHAETVKVSGRSEYEGFHLVVGRRG